MSSENVVGEILDGKYKIENQLGKGGMGTVYLATHVGTARPVAVKVIAPDFMKRAEFVERFRREARAAGRLRHPNVVDVTDFGFAETKDGENVAYLVMEYLDGCTLGEVLEEEKKLPLEFSIDILEQVCFAVEEAHNCGIIHRDLKPDNIWLEPNQRGGYTVKVLDFGIAKLEETAIGDSEHQPEIRVLNTSHTKLIQDKDTIVDEGQLETIADAKSSTIVSENKTIALNKESKTLVAEGSEAGTMIQETPSPESIEDVGLEDGTAVLPANETQLINQEDNKGTKIISAKGETEKSLLNSPSSANLTRVGAVLGTPLYMSPEQCRGQKLTKRSDIYSLAVITYQMLSGELPFKGDYVKVMEGHKTQEPPPLEEKKIPKKLKTIVMESLAKDVDERPETAEAFASKLRASSEGLGVLLRRAIGIYSERLPKLLLLAVLTFTPILLLTILKVGFGFLRGFGIIEDNNIALGLTIGFAVSTFFLQIITSAMLVGMTTWIVAQTLAYPLRKISLRAVFNEVKQRWKALAGTVTVSTLLSVVGIVFCFFPGIWLAARFMLIAPSIMMEGLSGRAAFRRSHELVKRSFSTVLMTAFLVQIIPIFLAFTIGFSLGAIIRNFEMRHEINQMKRVGVEPMTDEELKKQDTNISINPKGVVIETKKEKVSEEVSMSRRFTRSLREGIFELVWTPIIMLIASFTSVVVALIYFKTRQAGGESMQELLGKLDGADQPQTKWQQRVRDRLILSGKITGSTTTSSKS